MSIRTQGTDLYVVDPADGTIILVGCVTTIDGLDSAVDQIDTTCLGDTTRTSLAGLSTPSAATFTINTDPSDESHVRLLELKNLGDNLEWAIGWSDGTVAPTGVDSDDAFILPTTRSWLVFEGYMNSFSFSFTQNAVVTSTIGIQVSGEAVLVPAA